MTTALDRLEQSGLARRVKNGSDRRSIMIEATPLAKEAIATIWAPVRAEGLALLKKYDDKALEILSRFFKDYCDIQVKHTKRIRSLRRS